jgi:hypothetical protein
LWTSSRVVEDVPQLCIVLPDGVERPIEGD